ncbi:unnamed protein product [Ambrosiozyma monospora]|uniref:Unnamed protein product n=1 Tax=Ambrosiozyma monospora TaxID=43982 RepID=A0ACB5THW0_AMBMO|nr:unnamed protein product [Ambrosiozyma monospora]
MPRNHHRNHLNLNLISLSLFLLSTLLISTTPSAQASIFHRTPTRHHNRHTPYHTYNYKSANTNDTELFSSTFTSTHLLQLRNETANLFQYAWSNYLTKGFPYDEIKPIQCKPNQPDFEDIENKVRNDVMGNYSVTLIDNLDTLAIMRNHTGFKEAVELVRSTYTDFAIDTNVQVFEANIRVLGGLLSAHLYASDDRFGMVIDGYDGFLLRLAYDMGQRLILAFGNPDSDIPYPRVNLKNGPSGLPDSLMNAQCTAGVTSLILEFGLLSRLSGDSIFEDVTKDIGRKVWGMRSKLNLLPMTIDIRSGQHVDKFTGVGASIDSFYEYLLKYAVLFNDDEFMTMWHDSYRALLTHSQDSFGSFLNIHVATGVQVTEWIDSLAAFFPGLQVLAGDIPNAQLNHLLTLKLWNYYGSVPERWNFDGQRSLRFFQHLDRPYREGDLADGFDKETTDQLLFKNSIGLEWP